MDEREVRRIISDEKRKSSPGWINFILIVLTLAFIQAFFITPLLYKVIFPYWAEATHWEFLAKFLIK